MGISCNAVPPCRILSVSPNTAAAKANLQPDDVILTYDEKPVQDFDSLVQMIGNHAPGDKVTMQIERGESKLSVEVTLGEWD